MKLDFKRIMSSVLAFVMLFSSLIMVNVVSVYAGDTPWMADQAIPSEWLDIGGGKENASACTNGNNKNSSFEDPIFGDNGNLQGKPSYEFDTKSFSVTTSVDNATLMIYAARDSSSNANLTISSSIGDTNKPNPTTATVFGSRSNSKPIGVISVTLPKADKYTFAFGANDCHLFKLILSTTEEGSSENTWTLDDSAIKDLGLTGKWNLPGTTASSVTSFTLSYDGTDYKLDPDYQTVNEQTTVGGQKIVTKAGNTYTVKPVPDMLLKNVSLDASKIKVKNAANKVLHLECSHGVVFSFLLSGTDDGAGYYSPIAELVPNEEGKGGYDKNPDLIIPAHAHSYTATMGGGTLDKETFELTEDGATYEAIFTPTPRNDIQADIDSLDFSNLKTATNIRGERILGGTVLDKDGHFFVLGHNYNNTYKLSNFANDQEPSGETKAIVIRCEDTDVEQGGIGFTFAKAGIGEIKEDTTFSVTVKCVAVKDRESSGLDNTTIGIGEYDSLNMESGDSAFGNMVTKKITATIDPTDSTGSPENDNDYTSELITFDNLKPGMTYGIFNPGLKTENGNIRIYSISVKVNQSSTVEPEGLYVEPGTYLLGNKAPGFTDARGSKDVFVYNNFTISNPRGYEDNLIKMRNNQGTITFKVKNPSKLSMKFDTNGMVVSKADGTQVTFETSDSEKKKMDLDADTEYTIKAATSSNTQLYSITIESAATHDITISGSKPEGAAVTVNVGSTGKSFTTEANGTTYSNTVTEVPVGTHVLSATGYDIAQATIDVLDSDGQTFTGRDITKTAVKTTIKGKVDLTTNYEYVNHDSKDQIGKTDSDNGYKENITGNKNNVKEDVTGATVTVTKGGKSATGTVNADGTYEVVFPEDDAVAADLAEYTVRVSGTGIPAGTQNTSKTVSVEPGGTVTTDADFALNTPTYKVRFETNIKGYKFDIIIKKDGTEVFRLTDNTYHYSVKPEGALSDNARIESITHTIMMPEGNYTIEKGKQHDDGIFTLADEKGSALTSFTVKRSSATASNSTRGIQVEEIYLKSEIKSDVIDALIANEGKVSGSVVRGIYRFVAPTTQTSVAAAQCKYTLGSNPNPENDGKGIYAEGVYAAKNDADTSFDYGTDGRIDIGSDAAGDNLQGYVIFHIAKDESFLTKIDTAAQPCLLINLDTREVMTIDSLYSQSTIMLEGDSSDGTYYAIVRIGESKAHATSVLFDLSSPFKVATENIQPYTGDLGDAVEISNAALIIGTYDESGDTAGSSSLEDYDRFAIFVSANKDLLNYDHINSINETEIKFEQKPATEGAGNDYVISTDEPQNYNSPNVLSFEKQSGSLEGNVLGEQTDTLFEKIVITDDNIKEINNGYGYALIVNSLTPGQQYYAVGAALTSTSEGAKWLIQDTDAAQFSVD